MSDSAYDIDDGAVGNKKNDNIVGFLGIKHNHGFTLLNSAFVDDNIEVGFP
jgi:hypothetical protein